jgi:hypothetical protein
MNTTASVDGCTSCGALFEREPQDRGLCADCRQLLASEVPSDPGPRPEVRRRAQARIAPHAGRRYLRRLAMAMGAALMLAGAAGWWMTRPAKTGSGTWTALRSHSMSESWSAVRRRASVAWAGLQRQASEAWVAIRRHTPFDKPDAAPSNPSRAPNRDATASRGTHRRSR